MSYRLETLNRGAVDNCGFVYGNKDIKLGALPSMPIEQFFQYSGETILQIIESEDLDPKLKQRFIARTGAQFGRLFQSILDRNPTINSEEAELAEFIRQTSPKISRELAPIERDYPKNPFRLDKDKVVISEFYETDLEDFVFFASYIYGGGVFGYNWTMSPPPEGILKIATKLQNQLEGAEHWEQ